MHKLCRYITSRPGQLSLAIPLWVGAVSTTLGWEGNRRSVVALAEHHKQIVVYPPTGSMAYVREISTLPTLLLQYGTPLPFSQESANTSYQCHIV